MIRFVKNIIWSILNAVRVGGPLRVAWMGNYLHDTGWLRSYYEQRAVDAAGLPVPWCSYPFIAFIGPRLNATMDLFEYGSGNSTLWYASRVRSVTSVEHDKQWYDEVKTGMPGNVEMLLGDLGKKEGYAALITQRNAKYHIIVIDGRDRIACTRYSVESLTDDGVIVFDNAQVPDYAEAMTFLRDRGFKRIDFVGMTPIIPYENCTAVFYRPNNCLNI